ncbi:hypothetical protein YC2023_052548 [Brassica napus]
MYSLFSSPVALAAHRSYQQQKAIMFLNANGKSRADGTLSSFYRTMLKTVTNNKLYIFQLRFKQGTRTISHFTRYPKINPNRIEIRADARRSRVPSIPKIESRLVPNPTISFVVKMPRVAAESQEISPDGVTNTWQTLERSQRRCRFS